MALKNSWRRSVRAPQAAEGLFDAYVPDVLRAIDRRLRPDHLHRSMEAEDVVQEVFQRAFAAISGGKTFEYPDEFIGFLLTTTEHYIIAAVRRATAQRRSMDREQPMNTTAEIASAAASPADLAGDAADWETCLEHLPENDRIALRLLREGYSATEIVRLLEVSARTIERVFERARHWWNERDGGGEIKPELMWRGYTPRGSRGHTPHPLTTITQPASLAATAGH